MLSPSFVARNQAIAVLSDPTIGFNANYVSVFGSYSGAPPMVVDFGATSLSFFTGRVAVDDIMASGTCKFPLVVVYSSIGTNNNSQKFTTFAGLVKVTIDVHLSYKASQPPKNMESWPDAVEHAMINVFNQPAFQNRSNNLVYNGQIGYERGPLAHGAENWLQSLRFQLTFEVVV
jgi:hypothetical protein